MHIVYKTTCVVNGKIYIGAHTTDDLNDGYIGSGKAFLRAVKQHGRDAFTREVLATFDTPEAMYAYKAAYRDWETDRKSTRLNSSHRSLSRMPSSA